MYKRKKDNHYNFENGMIKGAFFKILVVSGGYNLDDMLMCSDVNVIIPQKQNN